MEPLTIVAIAVLLILIYFGLNSNDKFKSIIIILAGVAILSLFFFNSKRGFSIIGGLPPREFKELFINYIDENKDYAVKENTYKAYKKAIRDELTRMRIYYNKLVDAKNDPASDLTIDQKIKLDKVIEEIFNLLKHYTEIFNYHNAQEEYTASLARSDSWLGFIYSDKDYFESANLKEYKETYESLLKSRPNYYLPQYTEDVKKLLDETYGLDQTVVYSKNKIPNVVNDAKKEGINFDYEPYEYIIKKNN